MVVRGLAGQCSYLMAFLKQGFYQGLQAPNPLVKVFPQQDKVLLFLPLPGGLPDPVGGPGLGPQEQGHEQDGQGVLLLRPGPGVQGEHHVEEHRQEEGCSAGPLVSLQGPQGEVEVHGGVQGGQHHPCQGEQEQLHTLPGLHSCC